MGSFDCYCALCAGPLGAVYLRFGDTTAKALKLRNKRVELKKVSLAHKEADVDLDDVVVSDDEEMADVDMKTGGGSQEGGQEHNIPGNDEADDDDDDNYESVSDSGSWTSGDESESADGSDSGLGQFNVRDVAIPPQPEREDTFSQTSDLSVIGEELREYHGESEANGMYDFVEQASYDPTVLEDYDVKWVDRCRVLAFNVFAPGVRKAFISGRGRYDDYGNFSVKKPGKHPNDSGMSEHICFYTYENEEPPAFPFHEACFRVLARSLGYENPNQVDKDALYIVMGQFCDDYARMLALDYGSEQECGQFWECMAGEEVRSSSTR